MNRICFAWGLVSYLLGGGYVEVAESSYLSVGCWRDTSIRAIPTLEGTDLRLDGNYKSRIDPIQKCYQVASDRGFKFFAIQNGGWCASSANAGSRCRIYGKSTACKNGKGGLWANDVYIINKAEETCTHDGYKKAGCFKRNNKLFSELLVTDLDPTHHRWGRHIDWGNFQKSLHSIACRCEVKAREKNFKYFGIGFYGECWAGSNIKAVTDKILNPWSHKSSKCLGGDLMQCNDRSQKECTGIEDNEYIYLIVDDSTATVQPSLETWRDYPYSIYNNKECKAMIWEPKGCYDTKSFFVRGKLLVYWRYEIEWSSDRMPAFAASFVCACAEAAKAANVKYFGTHFWGECWALEMSQVKEAPDGDCILADGEYETKCYGTERYDFECLAEKSYFMYAVL